MAHMGRVSLCDSYSNINQSNLTSLKSATQHLRPFKAVMQFSCLFVKSSKER